MSSTPVICVSGGKLVVSDERIRQQLAFMWNAPDDCVPHVPRDEIVGVKRARLVGGVFQQLGVTHIRFRCLEFEI